MDTYQVYAIVNIQSKDAYVGITKRSVRRWKEHKWELRHGRHTSARLQSAWAALVPDAFEFVVIWTLMDVSFLAARQAELLWIDKIGTYNDLQADIANGKLLMREEARQAVAERNASRARLPEYRLSMGEHTKRRWADIEHRAALMNAPTRGKHHVKGMQSVKTPEQSVEHGAKMKALWADPEKRAKLEARRAARWTNPEAKARQAEKMRAHHAARRAAAAGQNGTLL